MSASVPPLPERGELVLAYLQDLHAFLRTIIPQAGAGVHVHRTSRGAAISVKQRAERQKPREPFTVYTNGTYVFVEVGYVTGVDGERVLPEEFPIGDDGPENWSFGGAATAVYLEVEISAASGLIGALHIKQGSVPAPYLTGSEYTGTYFGFLHLATVVAELGGYTIKQWHKFNRHVGLAVCDVPGSSLLKHIHWG